LERSRDRSDPGRVVLRDGDEHRAQGVDDELHVVRLLGVIARRRIGVNVVVRGARGFDRFDGFDGFRPASA